MSLVQERMVTCGEAIRFLVVTAPSFLLPFSYAHWHEETPASWDPAFAPSCVPQRLRSMFAIRTLASHSRRFETSFETPSLSRAFQQHFLPNYCGFDGSVALCELWQWRAGTLNFRNDIARSSVGILVLIRAPVSVCERQ